MWVRLLSVTILLLGLMLLFCNPPAPPPGPENAFVALEFKSSTGKITKDTLIDSTGKLVKICMIHNLTQYIDSSILKISKGTDFNEVHPLRAFKGQYDTTDYPVVFSAPGSYTVIFISYIEGKPTVLNGTITILGKQVMQNQKPALSVPKVIQTRVGQELTIPVSATDPDSNQQVTITVTKKPGNATFSANQLKWTPAAADTGSDTVIFTATDNGSPALTATDSCIIVVIALWKTDSLMVTFNSNGGSTVVSIMVAYGGSVLEPAAPTKARFSFAGWYSNQALTTPFDFSTTITAARTLYAKWNPVYNIVYLANGGSGLVPVDNNEYTSGQLVTVLGKPTGLTRQNYDFTGWNTASDGTGTNRLAGSTFQIGSKSDTLYANWKASLPVITAQPVSVNPYPFDSISFSVAADGIGLSYQWYKDSAIIPTATSAAFAKQKVTYSDSGFYHCIVSNSSGSTKSSLVKLAIRTTVKDADSNEYAIVVIGDQVWTAENLRTTRFNDGTSIPMVNDSAVWTNLTTPGYCFYYFTTSVNEQRKWGALYNWYTVNTGKLAPAGWHVSTDDDWETVEWYMFEHNLNWENSGFAALLGGSCGGESYGQGEFGFWWCFKGIEADPPSNAWARLLRSTTEKTSRILVSSYIGYSIRLVKN
ncbi:MAG: hypothetical protein GX639_17895 [Fibrobacter sp.]|nr:hypothetical protein [Fibrobacter sp.]